MPLNIIYGSSGTGKSEYILDAATDAKRHGKKVILIVPEQFSHMKETELIKKNGYISDDIKAISFKRLSYSYLKESSETRQNPDKIKKNIMVAKALYATKNDLTIFKNMHAKPGFVSIISNLISDFKRSCVTCEDVLNMAQDHEIDGIFKLKLDEIGKIYKKYQESIDEKFIDDDDNISIMAELIKDNEDMSNTNIYIDEFFRFTFSELSAIGAFLSAGADVTVSLCTPTLQKSNSGIFSTVVSTYSSLLNTARKNNTEISEPVFFNEKHRFKESAELLFLDSELPKYKHNIYKEETRDISLFVASDIYSETVNLACKISEAVQKENIRYRDIAIICGDPENYKSIIKTVFDIYEIPVFIDGMRELSSHPVMIMISAIFDILSGGLDTKYILTYIKSGYSTLTKNESDILENFILSGNIKKSDWMDDERFLKRAKSVFDDSEDLLETNKTLAEKLIKIKTKLLSPLIKLRESMKVNKKLTARINALLNFFEDISLSEKIQRAAESLIKDEPETAEEYAQVYNILMQTAESLIVCMGDEICGIEKMYDLMNAGFNECQIGVIPPVTDGVFFGDLSRSIHRNVRHLHILGANDGTFPPKCPPESILNDSERILLNQKGMPLAPDTKKMMFDYDFMVYNTLNISKNKVFISYSVSDLSGGGMRPSVLIGKLKKIFKNLKTDSDVDGKEKEPSSYILSKKSAFNYLISKKEHTDEENKLYELLAENEEYNNMLNKAHWASEYKKEAQKLSSDVVKLLYPDGLYGSVSAFEKYSGCPFSYFITYGLSAKERKLFDIDTPDFGSLLHRVIDIFSKTVVERNMSFAEISKETCEKLISEILDEIVDKMFIKKLYSDKKMFLLIKRLKKYATRAAQTICEHIKRGDFIPYAFEAEFSENGEMDPVVIDLPNGGKITLIGKIDRIDKYEKNGELYIKVVDYKTGNKDFSLSDIYNKLSLQLCVYMMAVSENSEKIMGTKAKTAGMFYFKLTEKTENTTNKTDVSDEEMLKAFKMSGIVLDDLEIIDAMERGLSGTSKILPVSINQKGEIVKKWSKTANELQFDNLKKYIKKTVGEIGREILDGKVDISPCREGKKTACDYCKFHSICAFDSDTDAYRQISTLSDDDVFKEIGEDTVNG